MAPGVKRTQATCRAIPSPGYCRESGSPLVGISASRQQKIPGRPAEDPLLLALIGLGIVIKPVRHSAVVERRPNRSGQHRSSRANALCGKCTRASRVRQRAPLACARSVPYARRSWSSSISTAVRAGRSGLQDLALIAEFKRFDALLNQDQRELAPQNALSRNGRRSGRRTTAPPLRISDRRCRRSAVPRVLP